MKQMRVKAIWLIAIIAFFSTENMQAQNLVVSNGTSGVDYDYDANLLTVKTAIPLEITSSSEPVTDRIMITSGIKAQITLNNVKIDLSGQDNVCAFDILGNASVALTLSGENSLKSGKDCPGLRCTVTGQDTAVVTIQGSGKLEATGLNEGAGIGGGGKQKAGIITIESGVIHATGGNGGSGIGSGIDAEGGKITIKGGEVTAIGGKDATGIGSSRYGNNNSCIVRIEGGKVTASGSSGIGGGASRSGGTIIITGGDVTATGGTGIGGGGRMGGYTNPTAGSGGNITISGGHIVATGGQGAGIGGGGACKGHGGNITITGGTVIAYSSSGAGIGGGYGYSSERGGDGGTIVISGGTVTAITGNSGGEGIGRGKGERLDGNNGSFSTGTNGNAFIKANGISDQSKKGSWSGVIINNNTGVVYGNTVTLTTDATIPKDTTLTVNAGQKLQIKDCTLHNDGTVANNGEIWIVGNGKFTGNVPSPNTVKAGYEVTFNLNYDNAGEPPASQIIESGKNAIAPDPAPERLYYTFEGWYDTKGTSGGTVLSGKTINEATLFYARWKLNTFSLKEGVNKECVTAYGEDERYSLSALLSDGALEACGAMTYTVSGDKPDWLTLDASTGQITGSPRDADAGGTGTQLSFTITAANGSDQTVTITFKRNRKALVVTPESNQFVYTDEAEAYEPVFSYNGEISDEVPAFTGKLSWEQGGAGADRNITGGTLALADATGNPGFKAANYDLKLHENPVTIHVFNQSLGEAYDGEASKLASNVPAQWTNADITLEASAGFKLQVVAGLRTTGDWKERLSIMEEGSYDFEYRLLRDGRPESIASEVKSVAVKLDKTAPELKAGSPVVTNLTAAFTLADTGSGIVSYSYKLDDVDKGTTAVDGAPGEHTFQIEGTAGEHTIILAVKDAAGNTNEFAPVVFMLHSSYIPPAVTYYTVTLPSVEGVTLSRKAGGYTVEEGYSFSFGLTLDEGYGASVPVVKANGVEITPRESDGKYVIRNIEEDIQVTIEGIVKDDPTANAVIDGGNRIYAVRNIVYIESPVKAEAQVVSIGGRVIRQLHLQPGTNRVEDLQAGVYVIRLSDGRNEKVSVR
ncbi:putative Ig domain-containing protein [Parabacteroides hominis]|uniref:InlB B-repeat-containing protein n=1 Tax=Parabacteroides hominis TaxID=2763057 RepID=A0ABR7DK60_9BACT|nr:putative Ig domain-containing protein [Parabacteroides hominis]MBC5631218.1 InlB B-repeat-containing protein [Parabacteroides hominis]